MTCSMSYLIASMPHTSCSRKYVRVANSGQTVQPSTRLSTSGGWWYTAETSTRSLSLSIPARSRAALLACAPSSVGCTITLRQNSFRVTYENSASDFPHRSYSHRRSYMSRKPLILCQHVKRTPLTSNSRRNSLFEASSSSGTLLILLHVENPLRTDGYSIFAFRFLSMTCGRLG